MHHFDDVGRALAAGGGYDVVCFGHNHRLEVERVGRTWLINPGAILGYDPAAGAEVAPSFVVFDTARGEPAVRRLGAPAGPPG